MLARLFFKYYNYQNAVSIAWNSSFDGEPCFPHGIKGIFVSGGAKIGRYCVIFQQVTIGSNTLADSSQIGAPTLGDRVFIGAGAKIIGQVTVGNNVRIGANAIVHKDVADNSVVLCASQRVISREQTLDNRYYSKRNGKWCFFKDGSFHLENDKETIKCLESPD